MTKDYKVFLKHILESIKWIEKETEGLSKDEFVANVPVQDAVIRRIEIIGEAIRNIPEEIKSDNPKVPWQDIMDMRNKLIHGYFGVDLNLVWNVVKTDVPPLKVQIEKMLGQS